MDKPYTITETDGRVVIKFDTSAVVKVTPSVSGTEIEAEVVPAGIKMPSWMPSELFSNANPPPVSLRHHPEEKRPGGLYVKKENVSEGPGFPPRHGMSY